MSAPSFLILLTVLLQSGPLNNQGLAPADAKQPTYLISPEAHEMIDPLDARTLANDASFIKALKDVINNADFSEADKADAFFLMRMKFSWAFIGMASIPPGFTYDRVFGMYLQTYRGYTGALGGDAGYDVKGLLEVARLPEPENIMRACSALLLAAVLDPQATRQTVIELCDPKIVEASVAPPITLHHLALCAALCDVGDDGFARLATLASKFPYEESQEDVLLALAYSRNAKARELIQDFAEEQVPKKFDLAVELALVIVRSQQKPEDFQTWLQSLTAKAETEELKKRLTDFASAKPRPIGPYHPQRGLMKKWDGFDMHIYNDGKRLTFGDEFSAFVPRL